MDDVLIRFKKEVGELGAHIDFLEEIQNQILNTSSLYVYVQSREKRQIDYKSLIISIYGLVENYVAQLVKSYLTNIRSEVPDYSYLKDRIKESHFAKSIVLASAIQQGKFNKFNHLNKEDVIHNLNGCITNQPDCVINYDAFVMQTGNLTHNKICELFRLLDIDLISMLKKSDIFSASATSANVFNTLDDLVDRRNEVAHGAEFDLLGLTELRPILNFVDVYFDEVYKVVSSDLAMEVREIRKSKCVEVNELLGDKDNGQVVFELFSTKLVGFYNAPPNSLVVGKAFIVQRSDGTLEDVIVEEVQVHEGIGVSVKLNKSITRNNKIFLEKDVFI